MRILGIPALALAAVGAAAVGSLSCGGSSPFTPPTPPPPTPPAAPATPTPGGGGVGANSCPIGRGSADAECAKRSPQLLDSIEAAIDALVRDRPELFNTQDEAGAGSGQLRVLDAERYLDGVVEKLRAAGHCAERTYDLERVVLKNTNAFSEEWDVLTSSGFVRRGRYAYLHTCAPAAFPVDPSELIAYVRTHLWSYECLSGITPPTPGERKIPLGCDGRVTATPKLRDGRDVPARIHGPNVAWELREGHEVGALEVDPRFPDNPFDKVFVTSGKTGPFYVCATVLGKEGCLGGEVIP